MNPHSPKSNLRSRQSGAALLVAVVLLLLAGLLTLLALNIGVFEQRSTANDLRAKTVREVAEAGLAQGFEYLMRQHPSLMEGSSWVKCDTADTTFPCGAVEQFEPDGTTPRRATMYKWTGTGASGAVVDTFPSELTSRMLPLAKTITTVGGFSVNYGVAPLLCYVAPASANPTDPVRCTTLDAASDQRVVTFVSVGSIKNESARTTLVQTVGRYNLFDGATGLPPIIAAGSVDITGGLQIVTNPNAGGTGVPVSVWTRKDVIKHGTPNTCYADEFFRFGAKQNSPPTFYQNTVVCDDCNCNGDASLSYDKSGNIQDEGIDILDVDAGTTSADRGGGVNYNVRSDNLSYPICEFPPDLFAHVFRVATWQDVDHDCVGERKVMTTYKNPNTGVDTVMGADEAYLYTNAALVINPTTAGALLMKTDQQYSGAYPSASLGGLIWCQSNCDIGSNQQLGTPSNPVVLVVDGSVRIQGKVFGLVFVRTLANGNTLTPATGYTMTTAEIASGGTSVLDMNAGSVVYGSVVVQGEVDKANGTASVVYNGDVLGNIEGPSNDRFSTLPGAWNDKWSY